MSARRIGSSLLALMALGVMASATVADAAPNRGGGGNRGGGVSRPGGGGGNRGGANNVNRPNNGGNRGGHNNIHGGNNTVVVNNGGGGRYNNGYHGGGCYNCGYNNDYYHSNGSSAAAAIITGTMVAGITSASKSGDIEALYQSCINSGQQQYVCDQQRYANKNAASGQAVSNAMVAGTAAAVIAR